jgi:enterochelin esterase-like enzyme/sugar lactone lactonase YvrE
MNKLLTCFLLLIQAIAFAQTTRSFPEGEIRGPFVWKSKIYPGTVRNYWIYVPKQYDSNRPACLMVVQDGLSRATGWKLPRTLDSLINQKAIPVMIGVFVDHGTVPATGVDNYPRYNRCFEYDALGDRYANFLLEELLPEVQRSFSLSKDPNDRSIAGASSGAICAFNVAWERPDQFRRVLSTIGTYVGLRGGDEFATLVRKTEPKPIRVFLEDGTKDLNIYGGDWWVANQDMLSALTWSGYEVNHAWGEGGGHDSKHASAIMADALVWLWKDYPTPVQAHKSMNDRVQLLLDGEEWNEIKLTDKKAVKLAVNKDGDVFFGDKQVVYKADPTGNIAVYAKLKSEVGALAFDKDGKLYGSDMREHKILAIDNGVSKDVIKNVDASFMTITNKGIYFTEALKNRIGYLDLSTSKVHYFNVPYRPTGISISAEQTFLNVGYADYLFGYSYGIGEDGLLSNEQPYIHYHIPYGELTADVKGMAADSQNLLYSATSMGVQVSDQLGRINFIFAKPSGAVEDVKLAGRDFNILYITCNGRLFTRKINAKGILSSLPPVKPPKPGL